MQRFETDMNQFKGSNAITDAQVQTMSLNEQNALRWLSLTVLETQMFHVRNQRERVDPTSPDAQAIMKMIDESKLTGDEKMNYKAQGRRMKERLDELGRILSRTREALNKADYAGSLDSVQAALASTQKELGDLSVDYSLYLEAPSTAWLAKQQAQGTSGGLNPFKHLHNGVSYLIRGGYGLTPWGKEYKTNMRAIEGDGKTASMNAQFTEISRLIASGRREDWAEARRRVIAMNPGAAAYSGMASPTEDAAKLTDALKISASLRANHEKITAVTETNKTLDAASTFVTWTISIALLAPVARASLNLVGKMSNVGVGWMNAGEAMGGMRGLAVRAAGRTAYAVGEIAKHTAARLESLEPDAGRIRAFAGERWIAQYAAASGARAMSVAIRQGTFTAMSAGISGVFTLGTHFYDVATQGGVRIGDYQAINPGHSMFKNDAEGAGKAFWTGFKGGAWWANESFHPALGYIGLPSTVFANSRLAGAMETIGSRGVVGSLSTGIRSITPGGRAAMEAGVARGQLGFLEKLSQGSWYAGKPAAFTLSMADNVAKYAIFSQVAGYLGTKWSWYVDTNVPVALPFVGVVNNPEEDVERRIKRANQTGHAWLESPAWLLIPTHAAHGARDAGPYMNVREGMKQYDMKTPEFPNGRTALYANAPVDHALPLKPVKPPLAARLFEARVFGSKPATEWIVTKQAKEMGQMKEVTRLAKEGGEINPIELMAVRDLVAGKSEFRTLKVTEEVQKISYEVATEGLVAQPGRAMEALTIEPGRSVKGWGKITPSCRSRWPRRCTARSTTSARRFRRS
ncbi:MAG: hypothetical protein M0D55_14035 [Elusimicrobiota bacterium]|nr:MAG: hypothetical protein M0D55_14035 [Elusimicrobiota bacterium]